ncbi:MAG: ABC transporter substrate binding protein [Desulfuromonadales bacterium]|nr:ABC transporter substrate binding protein [Desulfuromonadales bacterium]
MLSVLLRVFFFSSVLLSFVGGAAADDHCLISIIKPRELPHYDQIHQSFIEALHADSCEIYLQSPNPDDLSLRNSVRKAVAVGSSLIVTYGTNATLATRLEAVDVPVLFADVYDPVGQKLVSAKGLPVRNLTGVRGDAPLQTLIKAYLESTGSTQLTVLYDLANKAGSYQASQVREVGTRRDLQVLLLSLPADAETANILNRLPVKASGLFLARSSRPAEVTREIYRHALEHGIPLISQNYQAAEDGCLISLETDPAEQGTALAEMVHKVLRGENVRSIPLVHPRKVALIVNLKTAQQLGVKIPFDVLSMVTRVIR